MYKRVSTALHSSVFKASVSGLTLVVLSGIAWSKRDLLHAMAADWSHTALLSLLLLLPLTFLNLYGEFRKWKVLLNAHNLSIMQGFTQILAGMCSGFITPNRVGDFAGRMSYLHPQYHRVAPAAAAVGATLQGGITAMFGVIGLLSFPAMPFGQNTRPGLLVYLLALVVLASFAIAILRKSQGWKKRFTHTYHYFKSISKRQILRASTWALMRYCIFSSQFVLALYLFGFEGPVWLAYSGVFTLYFCQSFIPGPALGELGIREVLAVVLFASLMPHPACAVMAGLLLWLANIGLPILAGVSVLGLNLRHAKR